MLLNILKEKKKKGKIRQEMLLKKFNVKLLGFYVVINRILVEVIDIIYKLFFFQ